uniref:GDP-fucose protein O-fucosyltransferase 1 n=1 Tax=Macrostomum lignano TaxID=282301 RepID=A0A1I8FUU8_9PLAT
QKVGNPFGPFWDAFGVNFDRDEFYGNTAGSSLGDSESWQRNYPSNRWPVLAFMGAPASFPAQPKHLGLHRHVAFNEEFLESLNLLMEANDLQRPILGVHLRNNVDFSRACGTLLPQLPAGAGLFSSYQCFGPSSHLGQLSMKTCVPDDATILEDVNRLAKSLNIRTVFVATDFDAKLSLMKKAAPEAVKFVSTQTLGTDVFQDVGLLTLADAVLLNCASSLSAFVRRSRDAAGRPSNYLGLAGATGWGHDELLKKPSPAAPSDDVGCCGCCCCGGCCCCVWSPSDSDVGGRLGFGFRFGCEPGIGLLRLSVSRTAVTRGALYVVWLWFRLGLRRLRRLWFRRLAWRRQRLGCWRFGALDCWRRGSRRAWVHFIGVDRFYLTLGPDNIVLSRSGGSASGCCWLRLSWWIFSKTLMAQRSSRRYRSLPVFSCNRIPPKPGSDCQSRRRPQQKPDRRRSGLTAAIEAAVPRTVGRLTDEAAAAAKVMGLLMASPGLHVLGVHGCRGAIAALVRV